MNTEVNSNIFINPTEIRRRRLDEGFVTSQRLRVPSDDIGSTGHLLIEILRQIGPGQKIVAILRKTTHWESYMGGGTSYDEKEEEWTEEDLGEAMKRYQSEYSFYTEDPTLLSKLVHN